jgi:hypothetical protein
VGPTRRDYLYRDFEEHDKLCWIKNVILEKTEVPFIAEGIPQLYTNREK